MVAHHHLAPAPDYEGDRPLPRARAILDAFRAMGVELAMGGHLHRSYIGNSLDVSPSAGRDRGVVIVQCGTTTSLRGRAREKAKNSFNVIRLASEKLEVAQYLYFQDPERFAPVGVHPFPTVSVPLAGFGSCLERGSARVVSSGWRTTGGVPVTRGRGVRPGYALPKAPLGSCDCGFGQSFLAVPGGSPRRRAGWGSGSGLRSSRGYFPRLRREPELLR